jgi:hypothetical protein
LRRFATLLLGFAFVLIPTASTADDPDHLQCFKIKDDVKLKGVVDLNSAKHGLYPGCKISKAKMYCVSAFSNPVEIFDRKDPITPLNITGAVPVDRVCYQVKCPKRDVGPQTRADQFGNRTIEPKRPSMICTPVGTSDECTGALPICEADLPEIPGSTLDQNIDDVPEAFCGTSITAPGVWYRIIGTGDEIAVDTCNATRDYDTKISVFSGSCGDLVCVGGNDDRADLAACGFGSLVTWPSVKGETYLVLVHGFFSNTGNFGLTVSGAGRCK